MDRSIDDALKNSKYRLTLLNQFEQLRYKLKTKLHYSANGGTFSITPELIAFVDVMSKDSNEAIIIDNSDSPIFIDDLATFKSEICKIYNTVTKAIYEEFTELRKARNCAAAANYKEEK